MNIYLNFDLCARFGLDYYKASPDQTIDLPADLILNSNPEYDDSHRAFLTPLGSSVLRLRQVPQSPGWFTANQI